MKINLHLPRPVLSDQRPSWAQVKACLPGLIALLATLSLCGCAGPRISESESARPGQVTGVTRSAVAGTWHFKEEAILLDLLRDGHWKWWDLSEQSGRPSEPPMLSGVWSVKSGILLLKIESAKEKSETFAPGTTLSFEVRSIAAESLVLYSIEEKVEFEFRRVGKAGRQAAPL